jgi:hypothetical protein
MKVQRPKTSAGIVVIAVVKANTWNCGKSVLECDFWVGECEKKW